MEPSDIRRELKRAIERARRDAADRRTANDAAARQYERFLGDVAAPFFRAFANVLKSEGLPFVVFTPAGSVRLASEKSGDDFVELALDTGRHPPVVVGRVSRTRGRRVIASERPVREGAEIADLTERDLLDFVLAEIAPFVER
jgi:hypothetical protein